MKMIILSVDFIVLRLVDILSVRNWLFIGFGMMSKVEENGCIYVI